GRIAREVTERIVDLLEMVDVDVEQVKRLAAAARPSDRPLQQVLELHAVRYFRERVDARQVTDSLLCPAALGDVLRGVYSIAPLCIVARYGRTRVRDRHRFAGA